MAPKPPMQSPGMTLCKVPQPLLQWQKGDGHLQRAICAFLVQLKAFWLHLCPIYVTKPTERSVRLPGSPEWPPVPLQWAWSSVCCWGTNRGVWWPQGRWGLGQRKGHPWNAGAWQDSPDLKSPRKQGEGCPPKWQWQGGGWVCTGKPGVPGGVAGTAGLAKGHLLEQGAVAPGGGIAGYGSLVCLCTGLHASQGNNSFSNQHIFIKEHRICLHFQQVFTTEQTPHLLYSRAILALLLCWCYSVKSSWGPFWGFWLTLWAVLQH